jgi:hypothetical protein
MGYPEWRGRYEEWDWVYDDNTGFPRGENWCWAVASSCPAAADGLKIPP